MARRPYAGPRLIRFLAAMTVAVGVVSALWGVAYAINGATQAAGPVTVPVTLKQPLLHPDITVEAPQVRLPEGASLQPATGMMDLLAWDSTVLEQLLSRGGAAVTGVCLAAAAVLLRRLLLSVLEKEPFRQGNPARIAGLAGLVVLAGIAGHVLVQFAASLVLTRLKLTDCLHLKDVTPRSAPGFHSVPPKTLAEDDPYGRGRQRATAAH
ncbi:hypothetical protein Acor_05280 [Acrocarpospora corrugata]|uniref:DUF2975 domain-containing protein n=2 Tax=Acrocarpospora corrugata TaxID=35763 RepID=A0A5M3VNV3_9ACTN|nr:hypothetical protein Acor_05280 [Acrocarpospora corrugata]